MLRARLSLVALEGRDTPSTLIDPLPPSDPINPPPPVTPDPSPIAVIGGAAGAVVGGTTGTPTPTVPPAPPYVGGPF